MTQKNTRLVLTSVNQLIRLVQNNTELSAKLPRLTAIRDMSASVAPKKSCNCGSRLNITTPDVNKQVAENVLSSLTQEEFLTIKTSLNLEQLCYYKRSAETNSLELICI